MLRQFWCLLRQITNVISDNSDILIAGRLQFLQLYLIDMIRMFLFRLICQMRWSHQSQDDGKEDKTMEQAKHHHKKEHFEEDHKWIVVWSS